MANTNTRMSFHEGIGFNRRTRGVVIYTIADAFGLPQIGDELLAIHPITLRA